MHDLDRRLAAARLELGGEAPPKGQRRLLARLLMLARALGRIPLEGASGHA